METLKFASPITTALFTRTPEQREAWAASDARIRESMIDNPTTDITSLVNRARYTQFGRDVTDAIRKQAITFLRERTAGQGLINPQDTRDARIDAVKQVHADLHELDKDYRRKQRIAARIPLFPDRQFKTLPGERRGLF